MKKLLLISGALIMALFGSSCKRTVHGEGPVINDKRNIEKINEIELSIPANLTLITADSFGCIIGAQQNIANAIKTKVSGDELKIESDNNLEPEKSIDLVIALPHLKNLTVNGSGVVNGLNTINEEEVAIELNGSGSIRLAVKTEELKCEINGSGAITFSGKGNKIRSSINGSGDLHAYQFDAEQGRVDISGSGDAELNVSDELKAEINGSGNVHYHGNPHVKTDVNGSGVVQKE